MDTKSDEKLWYRVILKPSDVCFTKAIIPFKFDDGRSLMDTVFDIDSGEVRISDIPVIDVVWYSEKWEWYTLNNRRLWVFKELERMNKITYVVMKRVEHIEHIMDFPSLLYKEVELDDTTIHGGRITDAKTTKHGRRKRSRTVEGVSNSVGNLVTSSHMDGIQQENASTPVPSKHMKGEKHVSKDERGQDGAASVSFTSSGSLTIKKDLEPARFKSEGKKGDPNSGKEETAMIKQWEDKRLLFCKLYSKDESFHQHVASQLPSRSRSVSLSSLGTESSRMSLGSLSSLSSYQRKLIWGSGLSGYEFYEIYRQEYLQKIRNARKESMRVLKPYDVVRNQFLKHHSSPESQSSNERKFHRTRSRSLSSDAMLTDHYSSTRRRRPSACVKSDIYSSDDDIFDISKRRNSTLGTLGHSAVSGMSNVRNRLYETYSVTLQLREQRITTLHVDNFITNTKAVLYNIWRKRRDAYMRRQYSSRSPPALKYRYCCGICFKEFQAKVSLEQHSEELMHWGCVQCGRFFASRTSLGQHALSMGHREY